MTRSLSNNVGNGRPNRYPLWDLFSCVLSRDTWRGGLLKTDSVNLLRLTSIWLLVALAGCAVERAADDIAAVPVEVLLYAEATRPDELRRIVVPVMLNEQGPFYFLLDTGATRTVIARSAVIRLALKMDEQKRVPIRSVSRVVRAPTVMMQSLQVGALQSREVHMPVLSGSTLDGIDGILGVDTLGSTKIFADFLNNQLRITSANGLPSDASRIAIPFNQVGRRPIMMDVYIGRIRVRAIVDTGCAHTLGNTALLKALLTQSRGKLETRPIEVTDATDANHPAQLAIIPSIIMGSAGAGYFDVSTLPVSFGEYSVFDTWQINDRPALLIGMDVLSKFDELAIDYRRKELQMVKAPVGQRD